MRKEPLSVMADFFKQYTLPTSGKNTMSISGSELSRFDNLPDQVKSQNKQVPSKGAKQLGNFMKSWSKQER